LPTLLLEDDGWKQEIRDIELSETFIWSLDSEESDEVAPAVSLKAQEQSVPIVSLKPQENTAPPASNTGFSFASSGFKPQAVSGWKCDVCLVQNKEEVSKCISCESDKPGAKSSATKPAPVSAPVPPASNTGFSFASSGFKPQAVSGWKCDVCLVQNKEEVSKCISCESDKPGAKATKPAPAPPSTTGFSFNPTPSIGWKCQVCLIQNKEVDIQCVSCESTKPGNGPTVTAPKPQPSGFNFEATPKPNTSTTGFNFGGSGFQMKKASGWKCDVCMVDNQESSSQCVACETPKPGSSKPTTNQAPPSAGGFSIPQGMNVAPTFTFGGFDTSTSNSSGGFSFK
jgi:nuclear pore complex protein Nup153